MTLQRIPAAKELFFKGRPGDPRIGEWVKSIDDAPLPSKKERIVIFGCPDDLGVIKNRGRKGAKEGPSSIRKHFYKMALPMDLIWEEKFELYDLGDITVSTDILETHRHAFAVAQCLSSAGCTTIALGGGHDFAAPNFLGWAEGKKGKPRLALVNVDPHLDVRPLENALPNSGTPFRTVLESKKIAGKNFVQFGTRANRNARQHFDFCKKHQVQICPYETLPQNSEKITQRFQKYLKSLSLKATHMGLTIDMDSCREAEGTSAAPTVGFSTSELVSFSRAAGLEKKISFLELAEVAPALDQNDRSSRIAAEMLFSFLYARASNRKNR